MRMRAQDLGIDGVHYRSFARSAMRPATLALLPPDMVQKTLRLLENQDIHGRRSRLVEKCERRIAGTGLDEVGQDVIACWKRKTSLLQAGPSASA